MQFAASTSRCIASSQPPPMALIHCQKGISRSPIMAYLLTNNGMAVAEALAYVARFRPIVEPNVGFLEILRQWQDSIPKAERSRCRQQLHITLRNVAEGVTEQQVEEYYTACGGIVWSVMAFNEKGTEHPDRSSKLFAVLFAMRESARLAVRKDKALAQHPLAAPGKKVRFGRAHFGSRSTSDMTALVEQTAGQSEAPMRSAPGATMTTPSTRSPALFSRRESACPEPSKVLDFLFLAVYATPKTTSSWLRTA